MADTSLDNERLSVEHRVENRANATDLRQLFTVLLRRRLLILSLFCIPLSASSFLALMAKPTYQSSMQLLVSSNLYQGQNSNAQGGVEESDFTDSNLKVDYTAQLSVMTSPKLVERAVELLRPEYPNITVEEINGKPAKVKQSPLKVTQVESGTKTLQTLSQVFEVTFVAGDPIKSQKVLQALQNVYQIYNLEQQKLRLTNGLAFVNEQLPKIRKDVSQAEANLENFRKQNKLLDPEVQAKNLLDALAAVESERRTIRAQFQDQQARYNKLQQQISRSPQQALIASRLSQSPRYQSLLDEIQALDVTLEKLRVQYRDDYPKVQDLLKQRQNLIGLLRTEAGRSADRLPTQISTTEKSLPKQLQLGDSDRKLVDALVDAQVVWFGLSARDQSLAKSEQQLRSTLLKYPQLLAEYNRLMPEIAINRKTLEQLLQTQQNLGIKIAQGGFNWQIIRDPEPGVYMGTGRIMLLVSGAVFGLVLGIGAAFLLEALDDTIHSCDELQKLSSLPVLGITPKLPNFELKKPSIALPFFKQQSLTSQRIQALNWFPFRESMDLIYQNIQILGSPLSFKSLLLTSALTGEGKSTLAAGMALSVARLQRRVLLIDADLRRSNIHKLLNLSNDRGLSTLLTEEADVRERDCIQSVQPSLDVLTAGPTPTDIVKLLSSQRMKHLIESFEQSYDLVLVDAPPILGLADASIVASLCSGTVVVERLNRVTRFDLNQSLEALSKLNVIGAIINESKECNSRYTVYDGTSQDNLERGFTTNPNLAGRGIF